MASRKPEPAQTTFAFDAAKSAIFSSVFTPNSISKPTKSNIGSQGNTNKHDPIRQRVLRDAKSLLGIESEEWTWGRDIVNDVGEPFRLPLVKCADMGVVRMPSSEDLQLESQKLKQSSLVRSLYQWQVQLGAQHFQKSLAVILNELLSCYVRWAYRDTYRHDVPEHLDFWVDHVFCQFVQEIKTTLGTDVFNNSGSEHLSMLDRWSDTALTHLGALRVEELFSVIACEDPLNAGIDEIVEDLRAFVTNPATRTYLTNRFIATLVDRALQPGAATIDILRLYISIIRAFRKLDPKGVLLDRVAKHVRRYLRERDDTVKVIVGGLLSEPYSIPYDEDNGPSEVLTEVAEELHRPVGLYNHDGNGELDWDNMNWVPDPVDAAPDYMKSNATDVIGSLTSLFESKEVFVKELQSLLAERLLLSKGTYEHEVSVLHHLKTRFGDSALQACEVMLRDVLESSKVDALINRDLSSNDADDQVPRMRAKVLSRLFWPTMSEQTFTLPSELQHSQEIYEKAFERVKQSRQISWVHSLGQVDVELQLEDRTVREDVLPYQATVVYAFGGAAGTPASKSVSELASELSMSPTLVRSACIFWVSKRVLADTGDDTFTVLESLPDGSDIVMADAGSKQDASAAAAEAAAAQAAREAEEEERKQQMAMYHQFVVSMLTNQGAMPLPRIAMMLNIVVPGGFPFSNEELKEFLTSMVKDGQLEVGPGGNYKAIA